MYLSLSEIFINSISNCVNIILIMASIEIVASLIASAINSLFSQEELDLKKYLIYLATIEVLGGFILMIVFGLGFIVFLLFFLAFVKTYFILRLMDVNRKEVDKYGNFIIEVIIVVGIISFYAIGYQDSKAIINGESQTSTIIKTNDFIYTTGSQSKFSWIGETQSAVFLYNSKSNNTIILNRQNIDEIIIINKAINNDNEKKFKKLIRDKIFHNVK